MLPEARPYRRLVRFEDHGDDLMGVVEGADGDRWVIPIVIDGQPPH